MPRLFTEHLLCAKLGAGAKTGFPGLTGWWERRDSDGVESAAGEYKADSVGVKKRGYLCGRGGGVRRAPCRGVIRLAVVPSSSGGPEAPQQDAEAALGLRIPYIQAASASGGPGPGPAIQGSRGTCPQAHIGAEVEEAV